MQAPSSRPLTTRPGFGYGRAGMLPFVLFSLLGVCAFGCQRQPELIAPAAKVEPKKDQPASPAAGETESTDPALLKNLPAETELAQANPNAKPAKKPVADEGVKPASHVVELKNPTPIRRDVLSGPAKVPAVLLSKAEQALCKLQVGDQVPAIKLPDLEGQQHTLADLEGDKLTVVLFWDPADAFSTWCLADLTPDVYEPCQSLGVNVVGISSIGEAGSEEEAATKEAVERAGARFPNLIDAGGTVRAQFGTDRSTRIYLLDASGKIVWFDLEYSRSTRRDLRSALVAILSRSK